jgi:hypothetical protein
MNTKLRKTTNTALKLLVVVLTFVFLYNQLVYRHDMDSIIAFFSLIWKKQSIVYYLVAVLVLLIANISIETYKWQLIISKLEKVSFLRAIKAVLAGMAVSMFMPNRVGDYLGRVFILKKADRLQAVLVTIIGSVAQLITTLLFGLVATLFYYPVIFDISQSFHGWIYSGLVLGNVITAFSFIFAYLNFNLFSLIIKRISGRGYLKIKKYAEVFSLYTSGELLNLLLLSMARYLVFSFQFYLMLKVFQIPVHYFQAIMLIGMVYLFMTVIPTIALTEFGVRGSVSLTIFQQYLVSIGSWNDSMSISVVAASSLLWVVNLVFPAAIGTMFIFSLRFIRRNNVD